MYYVVTNLISPHENAEQKGYYETRFTFIRSLAVRQTYAAFFIEVGH